MRIKNGLDWFVFGLMAVCVVAFVLAVSTFVYAIKRALSEVEASGGLKPAIERVWCGAPGCMDVKK